MLKLKLNLIKIIKIIIKIKLNQIIVKNVKWK